MQKITTRAVLTNMPLLKHFSIELFILGLGISLAQVHLGVSIVAVVIVSWINIKKYLHWNKNKDKQNP